MQSEKSIFDYFDNIEEETKVKLVAEIFKFPFVQFCSFVSSHNSLKESIMVKDISYYNEILQRLNALPDSSRIFEKAKLQRSILSMPQEDVVAMREKLDDMCYR